MLDQLFTHFRMCHLASTYKPTVTALILGISLLVPCLRSSAQTLPDYLPTNGLVGWWPFNGNANDESGNGHHGVVHGPVATVDRNDENSSAFHFRGYGEYISLGSAGLSDDPYSFSCSVWTFVDSLYLGIYEATSVILSKRH
jgi:hypothetical protein